MDYFCWECETAVEVSKFDEDTILCRRCNSTFVEKIQEDDRPESFATPNSSSTQSSQIPQVSLPRQQGTATIQFVVAPMGVTTATGNIADILGSLGFGALPPMGTMGLGSIFEHPLADAAHFTNINEILARLLEAHEGRTNPTSQEIIDSLHEVTVQQSHTESGDSCAVCKDEYALNEKVIELPCSHTFHKDCIVPWLKQHNTCPVCRKSLPETSSA